MSNEGKTGLPAAGDGLPKTDGFGAQQLAEEMARGILARHGHELTRCERQRIVRCFRRILIAPRRPGRKQSPRITAALSDWRAGMRGLSLYQQHIPGFRGMNYFRRRRESRRLLEAIRTRERCEQLPAT